MRLGRVATWVGLGLAGLAGLMVVTVAVVLLVFDWNDLRGFVARRASAALNRQVTIDGPLRVDLGDPAHIHIEGLHIANVPWSDDPTLLDVRALDLTLRLRPLLSGRIELPEVRVAGPDLILERNREGAPNWLLGADSAAPPSRRRIPIIDHLAVEQGRLRLRDPNRGVDTQAVLTVAEARGGGGGDLALRANGAFAGKPMRLAVDGASLVALRDSTQPYPIRVEASVGDTRARISGTMVEPVQLKGLDLTASFQGPDLTEVLPAVGLPVPRTPPYALGGRLGKQGATWTLGNLQGRLGESDVAGWLALDLGGARPLVRGELFSNRLVGGDLLGLVGAAPDARGDYPTRGPQRVLPATPVDLAILRGNDVQIAFTGKDIDVPWVPLGAAKGRVRLEAGLLTVDPLAVRLAGGDVSGSLVLDGRQRLPAVRLDLRLTRLQIADFFRGTPLAEEMGGTVGGRIQLAGQGASTADILDTSGGRLALAVHGGKVSSLVISALETDILETLGIALSGDDRAIAFNCLVGDFVIKNGVLRSQTLVLDTKETTVSGDATVDMGKETLDMRITGNPKELNILGTQVPVRVTGRFRNPDIALESGETVARGGLAAALGALLTPLAGLAAFLQPPTAEDAPCADLVTHIRRTTQTEGGRRG